MSGNIIKQINERIKEGGGFNEVGELDLSDLKLKTIPIDVRKVLDKAKIVEVVLLQDNELQNFDNLPDWNLNALDISNNKLTDNALKKLSKFTNIAQILANNNQISTIQGLAPLFLLQKLQELDLSDNPVTTLTGYRELLFQKIPTLTVLDGLNAAGEPVQEEPEDDGEVEDDQDQEFEQDQDSDEYDEEQSESPPKKKK